MVKVLLFSRGDDWYGGVVNFVTTLIKNTNDHVEISQFIIGQRKNKFSSFLKPVYPLVDSFRLTLLLARRKYDSYHVNPSLNFQSLMRDGLLLLILRLFRVKNVIVTFHGWNDSTENTLQKNTILLKLFVFLFSYARVTLVLSETFRQWLIKHGFKPSSVHLFTTMFDSEEFPLITEFETSNQWRLLFLSRLVREKGMYELLEAFKVLSQDYPDLELFFAGTGPEENDLRKKTAEFKLNDRVTFLGYVEGGEKVKAFHESGVFVFPTYYGEGCPVSLLEAMASGLPIITTTVGGIPHIIEDGVNGLLLEDVSASTIEAALRKLLEDDSLKQSISERNFKDAWEKYSAPVIARTFERLYAGESL